MARPARPWFRFYVEAFGDRKLRRLKPEYRWLFAACLGAARQSPQPGVLLVTEGHPMDARDLADYAGMDVRSVKAGLKALEQMGLIVKGSYEDRGGIVGGIAYTSPAFQKRQYESDDVTKRTRKYRLTSGNSAEGTFPNGSQERSRNGDGNAPETETETETEKTRSKTPAADPRFEEFWAAYPRRVAKGAARKAWATAIKTTAADGIIAAAENYANKSAGSDPKFIPHPASWLNAERWADEMSGAPKVDDQGREVLPPLPGNFWDQR